MLPASFNLRDLGGLPLRSGGSVAAGRFYRCGDPSRLDAEAAEEFAALGFRTVIDLRMTLELGEHGTAAMPASCRHVHQPLFENVRANWIAPADQSPAATATRYLEMLHDGSGPLARIVGELAHNETQPFAIHCAAGRDRTGIVVACLLDLLDAGDDAIAADYALSDAVVDDGGRAHAATMLAFLALLRAQHGSTRELLLDRGISAATVARLKRHLVAG